MTARLARARRRARAALATLRDALGRWQARRSHLRQLERIFG